MDSLIFGISPGQKAQRGLATTKGILSYTISINKYHTSIRIPLFVEGVPAIAGGVVLGDDRRCFFEEDLTVYCRHYPVDLRSPPLLQKGEYLRSAIDTNQSGFARHPFLWCGEFRSKCGIYL